MALHEGTSLFGLEYSVHGEVGLLPLAQRKESSTARYL